MLFPDRLIISEGKFYSFDVSGGDTELFQNAD